MLKNPYQTPTGNDCQVVREHILGRLEIASLVEAPMKDYEFFGANLALQTDESPEIMLAGPADCGKTIAALTKLHRIAWTTPKAQIVIVRKIRADIYGSVLETYYKKILPYEPGHPLCPVRVYGGETPQRIIYPNGATIWLAGMDKPGKVLSSERDIIYVNQAEQLEQTDWELLGTRATGRAGYAKYPQLIGDCNPSGPYHWIMNRKRSGVLKMLTATHKDNPELYDHELKIWTDEGQKRLDNLKTRLTGYRLKRLYYGEWVAPDGAIFEGFDEETNTIDPVRLPLTYPRAVGVDPYGAFVSAVWVAWDSKNMKLHVYREYKEPFGIPTRKHCKNMIDLSVSEFILAWAGGGPSENQARVDFTDYGVPLQNPPNVGVWAGIDRIIELLDDKVLVIHRNCVDLISQIGEYRRKINNGVPTDTIENKDQYHMIDALRYIVTWLLDGDVPVKMMVGYEPVPTK